MSSRLSPRVSAHAEAARALDGGAGSGMGADSAFEVMIRLRPIVHRPAAPQSPSRRGLLGRRHLG